MALFIGRLSKTTRLRDLEGVFERYGRMSRCDLKYGAEMAYGFVDFEDRRDAEDALRYEHGRDLCGSAMIVEWARGPPRRGQPGGNQQSSDECYKCNRFGHWARNCPEDRRGGGGGYRGGRPGGGGGGGGGRRDRSRSRSRDRVRRRGSGSRRSRSPYERRRRLSRSRSRSPSSRSRSPYANGNGNAGASRSPSPT